MRARLAVFSSLVLALLFLTIFARWLCPYDPYAMDLAHVLEAPSWAHPFGTDRFGRDMLSRVIIGAQTSIFSALIVVALTALGGTAIGVAAALLGKVVDACLMRITDVFLAFPGMVFALALCAVLGGGVENAVLALVVSRWPKYARLARSQTLAIRQSDFILAARLAGCGSFALTWRHILPNICGQILVAAVLDIGQVMMEFAALSFLGLGAAPPTAEWGSMMSAGRSLLWVYPWVVLAPGVGIFIAVALFNLWGDAVQAALRR